MKIVFISVNLRNKFLRFEKEFTNDLEFDYIYLSKTNVDKINKKLYRRLFKYYIKQKVLKHENCIFILSKDLRNFSLDKYFDFGFNEYVSKNTIKQNSICYLENISSSSSILLITNELEKNIVRKYIESFKEISIYTENVYYFSRIIKELENEYGTSINLFDKKSNIYITVDAAVYLDDLKVEGKVISKKNIFLTENMLDCFSKEYEIFKSYKDKIKNIDSYPERKLAMAIAYLHNFNQKN